MISRPSLALFVTASFLLPATALATETFSYSFNDGLLPNTLRVLGDPGFSIDFSTGAAVMSKQAGVGSGMIQLSTNYQLLGDFVATVDIFRNNFSGAPNGGIYVYNATGGAGIFGQGPGGQSGLNSIIGYISLPSNLPPEQQYPGYGSGIQFANTGGLTQFQISRVGNLLTVSSNQGVGFSSFRSATSSFVTGPDSVSLFLGQEFGNTSFHQVTFDNLSITTTATVPEPSIWALALLALGAILGRQRLRG